MTEFILYIKDLTIQNKPVVRQKFDGLKDGRYLVVIKKANTRSLPQNAFYWACLVPLVKEALKDLGFTNIKTDNDAHELMKNEFLKKSFVNELTGEIKTIVGSTTELSTVDFMNYIEEINRWAAEYLGICLPNPNEQIEIFKPV